MDNSLREELYEQLEGKPKGGRGLSPVNWTLLLLILLSLVLYTAETEREFGLESSVSITIANIVILVLFGLEFVARLYAVGVDEKYRGWRGKLRYAKVNWFMVSVDFLAFAPELFFICIGTVPPRWLRVLRVARLFKIARYFPAFKLVANALKSCLQELLAALAVAVMLWYISSVALYFAESEAQPEACGSITRSMWWSAVTLTTVGYGDTYPVTVVGKVLAGFVAVLGIVAVAMPSGILAGAFMEKLREGRR